MISERKTVVRKSRQQNASKFPVIYIGEINFSIFHLFNFFNGTKKLLPLFCTNLDLMLLDLFLLKHLVRFTNENKG